jgi:hypothetical protein
MYMMQAGKVFRTSNPNGKLFPDVDTKATKTFNTFVSLSALLLTHVDRQINESSKQDNGHEQRI